MTYSLNTLNVPDGLPAPPPAGVRRVLRESVLIGGFCALAFWLMALLSYSVQDPAWTGSGMGAAVHNWGGRIGALVAEALDWAGRRQVGSNGIILGYDVPPPAASAEPAQSPAQKCKIPRNCGHTLCICTVNERAASPVFYYALKATLVQQVRGTQN